MTARERASILAELTPAYDIHIPARQTVPFVFCSPHSGRIYPRVLLESTRLRPGALRKSEDCYVDELFAGVTRLGAPLLAARFPRAYLDVNREPYELDPELFDGRLPEYANTHSMRVVGGLGTIARIVAESEEIYREPLAIAAGLERIDRLYRPFHAALAGLLEATRQRFGIAILVDCHSMPSSNIDSMGGSRPDIVLGDRFGVSCDGRLTRVLRDRLAALGYDVALNRPYAGGFITEHYGRPAHDVHAVQIELKRALYLNEETFERSKGFAALAGALDGVMAHLVGELPAILQTPLAAE